MSGANYMNGAGNDAPASYGAAILFHPIPGEAEPRPYIVSIKLCDKLRTVPCRTKYIQKADPVFYARDRVCWGNYTVVRTIWQLKDDFRVRIVQLLLWQGFPAIPLPGFHQSIG